MAAAPLQRWRAGWPPRAHCAASAPPALMPSNPSAALQIPVPSLISQNPPPPLWGFLPVHHKKRGGEGEKEKLGERRTGGRPWESPKPSRRWTTRPSSVLQGRPPERGRPCVDREGAGAVQAADDRPFTEPSPQSPSSAPPRLLRRLQEHEVSTETPSTLQKGPSLRPRFCGSTE
jgi:hypothetical protein